MSWNIRPATNDPDRQRIGSAAGRAEVVQRWKLRCTDFGEMPSARAEIDRLNAAALLT